VRSTSSRVSGLSTGEWTEARCRGSGTRLANNQHGRVRLGDQSHFVQDFRERATVAYDLTGIVRCFDLLTKVLVLEAELAKRVLSAPALVDIAEDQCRAFGRARPPAKL
jgi:hypothetical protein